MPRNVTSLLMGDPPPHRSALATPPQASASKLALSPRRLSKPAPLQSAGTPALGSEGKGPAPTTAPEAATVEAPPASAVACAVPEAVEDGLRPVAAICTKGLIPCPPASGEPIFERVNPRDLLVEEAYQRDLSDRSLKLIQKIVEHWDWTRFKPPVVAFADDGLRIIDGQHTAIAAASHPAIDQIPVMVVEAPELATRALAFIGHNRDRLTVTPMQLHHAAVAAGEREAVAIEAVCGLAGVRLLRKVGGGHKWQVGETQAINALRALVQRCGRDKAAKVLSALVAAELAPIAAHDLRAAEMLFSVADYADQLDTLDAGGGQELAAAIRALGDAADKEARIFAAAQCVPYWRALGVTWFKKCRKRRRA